jgi:RNA polymerase sigma-70 factor (ECF subfamily)
MEQPGDEELIEKSKAGDMAAFKMLVIRHEGQVAGVIRTLLGATPEAEDVGQEVFIRFFDSLNKFRGDSKLSTYLVRIAINLSLNELKKRKRSASRYASIKAADGVGGVEDMLDLKEHLQYAFEKLDPDFRAVATLRLVEGYSTEETAGILEIPIGTALSRLARAQQKLRISLSKKLRP